MSDPREPILLGVLRRHWPEYAIEAGALGLFMVSATLATALLEYPASPVHRAIPDPLARRAMIGIAMGLTAIGLIYSPAGRRSGAHMNPAVTLAFLRLGKIRPADAMFYILAQFAGGVLAMLLISAVPLAHAADPSVAHVVTSPGPAGPAAAFAAELAMAFGIMMVVLTVSNSHRMAPYTGLFAGTTVALYITVLGPVSGMSINPARSLASAVPARMWMGLWIYFIAPPLGMQLAARAYLWLKRGDLGAVLCAKLCHDRAHRCIFNCGYCTRRSAEAPAAGTSMPQPA